MSYSLYNSWTIEDTKNIGAKFKATCHANYSYEDCLVEGNDYIIEIIPRILPMSPLCQGIGKNGKRFKCHLTRFTKIERVKP